MMQCVQTSKIWVHDKKRYSAGKKDKCMLALALHIVGNPTLLYKYDVFMLLLHVQIVFMSILGLVCARVHRVEKTIKRCK